MSDQIYSADQVEGFRQSLIHLAEEPRTQFSKRQTVEELFSDIEAALEGHTYQEVALRLREQGLDISKGSLKQYFTRIRRERQRSGGGKKRRQKSARASGQSRQADMKPDVNGDRESDGKAARQPEVNSNGTRAESPRPVPKGADEPEFAY